MAGEMNKKELEEGGEWFEVKQNLLAFANDMGFEQSYVEPFDQYQGPQCFLKVNDLVVGSLWMLEDNGVQSYHVVAENGRRRESLETNMPVDAYEFVLNTWKDWNMGYNPEDPETLEKVVEEGDLLKVSVGDLENVVCFEKTEYKDELSNIVKYFQEQLIKYQGNYYKKVD